MKKIHFCFVLLAFIYPCLSHADNAITQYSALNNAGLLLVNSEGQALISDQADKRFIPASTTKLVTAWLALNHWGENHQFKTEFFLDTTNKTLWVKGSGDPYLVSEELRLIAQNLKQLGLQNINAIGLDSSFFRGNLLLPGTGNSDNPYDAVASAIAANFNTVNVKKANGQVISAEAQTPLTAYAEKLSRQFNKGILRVNTGADPRNAERYFAELLGAFLRNQDIQVGHQVIFGHIPVQNIFYTHVNSRNLAQMIRPMLKYSTNFIANQLILILSAEFYQRPANATDVKDYMEGTLSNHFHWQNFTLEDGAGLSHANRLSPAQLVELLEAFRPWKNLLPEIEPDVFAKTGTLNDVSTLAGYIVNNGNWEPFALMMNQAVPDTLRNQIALELVIWKHRKDKPVTSSL